MRASQFKVPDRTETALRPPLRMTPPFGLARPGSTTRAAPLLAAIMAACSASADPVINEVYYESEEQCAPTEFVEIHNPDGIAVDLTDWRLDDAIQYTFPPGTTLEPDGYLVVAQNPAELTGVSGVSALGPWTGRLNNDGENIELRNSAGREVDAVDYRARFPWPIAPAEGKKSMELINPGLDNDLGSSWRASLSPPAFSELAYFTAADRDWRYRKGTSDPAAGWNAPGFVEGSDWLGARAPLGYGNVGRAGDGTLVQINTTLGDMLGGYSTVYLRGTFPVAPGEIPPQLIFRHNADDGFVAWINGIEIARVRADGATGAAAETASDNPAPEGRWESLVLADPSAFLVEGENLLAIVGLNEDLVSSDFAMDFELIRPATADRPAITPGARNSVFSSVAPPNIRQVEHHPAVPDSATSPLVTAKVTDPHGVASVQLHYQLVRPGRYIPAFLPHPVSVLNTPGFKRDNPRDPNAAFEDPGNWTTIAMSDDGSGGDATAGDSVYSAVVPAFPHRHLVRYRITVEDGAGAAVRVPYADDPSLNFAFFVYDGVPDYRANGRTYRASMLTEVPVYHLITRNRDLATCRGYDPADRLIPVENIEGRRSYNWEGAWVYDGIVYDHINYRLRGSARYQPGDLGGKRSWKFRFNRGRYLAARNEAGDSYRSKWRVLETSDLFSNRGVGGWGLTEAMNTALWRLLGLPAPHTHWFHWRVIDHAPEAPDQWGGDFWGLSMAMERYDVRFLDQHGLPRGNLYKMQQYFDPAQSATGRLAEQQRYQGCEPGVPMNYQDLAQTMTQFNSSQSETWIRRHSNLEMWYRYSTVAQAVRHYDTPSRLDFTKNIVYYFEPPYLSENDHRGRLWLLPHDHDDTWGPVNESRPEIISGAVADKPQILVEEKNTVREFRDLIWQRDQLDTLLDAMAEGISGIAEADEGRWKGGPAEEGVDTYSDSLVAKVADMKKFAWQGGSFAGDAPIGPRDAFLDSYAADSAIPAKPTITYRGEPGFPVDGLAFESSAFADPQGNHTFGAMEWRLAEITPAGGRRVNQMAPGGVWKYLDTGIDQGTAWRHPGFDDDAWPEGAAPLGGGDIFNTTLATPIDIGPEARRHGAIYFRTRFELNGLAGYGDFVFRTHIDDGAVVYVNGVEAFRDGFNAGVQVQFDSLSNSRGNEGVFDEFTVDRSLFVEGENIIAVEVHQVTATNNDLVFDLAIDASERLTSAANLKLEGEADWQSGARPQFSATILVPDPAIRPDRLYRARVRHLDNTGRWSHWSAPVDFRATAPDLTPLPGALVISEIMYNPLAANAAELAAGFTTQDFEWIEVMNIGTSALDLRNLRFTKGVDFDFVNGAIPSLAPGTYALVVRNRAAFEFRYGAGLPVAGQYGPDRLDNGGEQLKLSFGAGVPVRDFIYDDDPPWPTAPDGAGYSLTLIAPEGAPDHDPAENWRPSVALGGSPNGSDALRFSGDPGADDDRDGISAILEHALGSSDAIPSTDRLPRAEVEEFDLGGGVIERFGTLTYRQNAAADDLIVVAQRSTDLAFWESGSEVVVLVSQVPFGDGIFEVKVRSATPVSALRTEYFRLHVSSR